MCDDAWIDEVRWMGVGTLGLGISASNALILWCMCCMYCNIGCWLVGEGSLAVTTRIRENGSWVPFWEGGSRVV